MVMYPDKLKLAQKEMDAVLTATGSDFPNFALRPKLPYLDAVVKETMRWHLVLPLGQSISSRRSTLL